jgi:hypothetical protein
MLTNITHNPSTTKRLQAIDDLACALKHGANPADVRDPNRNGKDGYMTISKSPKTFAYSKVFISVSRGV